MVTVISCGTILVGFHYAVKWLGEGWPLVLPVAFLLPWLLFVL